MKEKKTLINFKFAVLAILFVCIVGCSGEAKKMTSVQSYNALQLTKDYLEDLCSPPCITAGVIDNSYLGKEEGYDKFCLVVPVWEEMADGSEVQNFYVMIYWDKGDGDELVAYQRLLSWFNEDEAQSYCTDAA